MEGRRSSGAREEGNRGEGGMTSSLHSHTPPHLRTHAPSSSASATRSWAMMGSAGGWWRQRRRRGGVSADERRKANDEPASSFVLRPSSVVEFDFVSLGGLALMERLVGCDRAILVDAIQTRDGVPGVIYRLTLDDLPTLHADAVHDASLKAALGGGAAVGGKTAAGNRCHRDRSGQPLGFQRKPLASGRSQRAASGGDGVGRTGGYRGWLTAHHGAGPPLFASNNHSQ